MSYNLTWNPPKINRHTATYEWAVDYAWAVHEGGYSDGTRLYPRPWVWKALQAYINVLEVFLTEYDAREGNIDEAFRKTADELFDAFQTAIEAVIYPYPTTTIRSDGSIATSPRSIVDTGALRDSQSMWIS